jgi:hypothetical protein
LVPKVPQSKCNFSVIEVMKVEIFLSR